VAQLASVLAWGASGRPFESDHPDKKMLTICKHFFYSLTHQKNTRLWEYLCLNLNPLVFVSDEVEKANEISRFNYN